MEEIKKFLSLCIQYIFFSGQARLGQISRVAKCTLNSFTDERSIRPMKPCQQVETIERYARVFQVLVTFLLASYRFQQARQDAPRAYQDLYTLTDTHTRRLEDLTSFLARLTKIRGSSRQNRINPIPDWDDRLLQDPDDEIHLDAEMPSEDESTPASQAPTRQEARYQEILSSLPDKDFSREDIQIGVQKLVGLFMDLACVSTSSGLQNPLYMFLACFSFDYHHGVLKELNQITQIYSAIIKGYQFTLLHVEYQKELDEVIHSPLTFLSLSHFSHSHTSLTLTLLSLSHLTLSHFSHSHTSHSHTSLTLTLSHFSHSHFYSRTNISAESYPPNLT